MSLHARRPGDPVLSAAKVTAYGTVGAAVIAMVGAIIVARSNDHSSPPVATPIASSSVTASKVSTTWTTMTPTPVSPGSDQGLVDKYAINDSGTEVKVWGHADKNVDGVFVLIGPKPVGFWPGFTNVFNQQWEADVPTDPQISPGYKIWAYPHTPSGGAASPNALKFTFQATGSTTTPPLPPDQLKNCAAQHGPDCFTGPGWGPPSVYQPNQ
jgi:hypothetical protein